MRKVLGGLVLVLLAGCSGGSGDLLLLRTAGGLAVVEPRDGTLLFSAAGAVPSQDWGRVLRTERSGRFTILRELDPANGATLRTRTISGALEVGAVSADGGRVALTAPHPKDGLYPKGRVSTPIVISDPSTPPRTFDLGGNFQPEAFSSDGRSLFVIEYVPSVDPDRYRVRRLDVASGRVMPVRSLDQGLQEAMRGTARTQAMAPDGRRLYTMYTLEGGDMTRSFVHMLALDEQWAHCIDLPVAFGSGPESSLALTVSPDSRRLYVADTHAGLLAEIDTSTRRIVRTVGISLPGTSTARASASRDRIYLARGSQIVVVDRRSLKIHGTWWSAGKVSGLQPAADGAKLYVALDDRIEVLDADSGRRVQMLRTPGIDGISQIGRADAPIEDGRTGLKCAC